MEGERERERERLRAQLEQTAEAALRRAEALADRRQRLERVLRRAVERRRLRS